MRVVLSAANPGAAFLIRTTLDVLARSPEIDVVGVLVQPPADGILSQSCADLGIPCMEIDVPRIASGDEAGQRVLSERLSELAMPLMPDAVITGLSGPDIGVDEGLVHLARLKGWLAYSVQDGPGWVVPGLAGPAPNYFVQNAAHVRQTECAPGVSRAISVGALKLLSYSVEAKACAARAPERSGASFLGQPLWHLSGYEQALVGLADALAEAGMGPLVYRPHPLEDPEAFACVSSDRLVREDRAVPYEETLLSRSVLASCFSTGLQDAAQLAALVDRPSPRLMYCLDQEDIRDAFVSASQPLQRTIDEQPFAQFVLNPPTAETLSKAGPAQVACFEAPEPERIAQTLLKDWATIRFLPQSYAADSNLTSVRADQSEAADRFDTIPGLVEVLAGIAPRTAPLQQVIPPQGGNYYLRTELEGHGPVFLKTIHRDHAARLGSSMRLEAAVAETCPHVAAPLTPVPVPLGTSDRCVALWPWLDSRPLDPCDPDELRSSGHALGSLHVALQDAEFPSIFAQERVNWLLQSWRELRQDDADGLLGRFHERFPWFKMALTEVSRGLSDRFLSAPRQLIHGDLNPGNLLCLPGPMMMFIDFEEAVQSFLPTFFDLTMMIERQLMTGAVGRDWQNSAAIIVEAYVARTGTRLPYAECVFDARCFSILRSLAILVVSERVGRPWPDSEWHKFDKLTRYVLEQEQDLSTFARAFT